MKISLLIVCLILYINLGTALRYSSHRITSRLQSHRSVHRSDVKGSLSFQRYDRSARRLSNKHSALQSSESPVSDSKYDIKSKDGVHSISFKIAGKTFSFETGKIGRQAAGAVIARTEDTIVYSTVCCERDPTPVDFTPLRVDYFARYSAVGQTVGAFHRRDSRGDDAEILIARLIDRPMRPMIVDGWQHETQSLTWVLSYDKIHSPEPLAICAASAAISISEIPFTKPIAGVEVGLVNGELVINPTKQEMANSTLQLTVAGTKDGILMIEGAADFLPEELMVEALKLGHSAIGDICDAISALQAVAGAPKRTDTLRKLPAELVDIMDSAFGNELQGALSISDKHERGASVAKVEEKIKEAFSAGASAGSPLVSSPKTLESSEVSTADGLLAEALLSLDEEKDAGAPIVNVVEDEISFLSDQAPASLADEDEASEIKLKAGLNPILSQSSASLKSKEKESYKKYDSIDIKIAIKKLLVRRLREMILKTGQRSDGRGVEGVRPISIETSFLPGAHGSSLFTRGETQALATATLGGKAMEARFETLDELSTKRFYLQYRFPPSSVGEVGRVGGVNRREVGHGNLAERALIPCIPSSEQFPYSIRAESLITESCGSSSMATVCGCCLAMLDAGVPLKATVAGVAMGLILGEKEGEEPVVLTDILGLEDALGTMDFKVAGNETGITTFQLDIKSEGLTLQTLEKALMQARRGRLHILKEMKAVLAEPRELKNNIPRILEFSIPPESLGKVIGPKGKTVQTLIETYGVVNINLDDSGSVQVESFSSEKNLAVQEAIKKIVSESSKPKERRERKGSNSGNSSSSDSGEDGQDEEVKPEPGPPPEPGTIYRDCEIKGVHAFGVFVEITPGYEGLVHVSELDTKKVVSVEKAGFVVGQKLDVKYLGKNEKGQMRLSRRAVLMRDSSPSSAASNATSTKVAASAETFYQS